MMKSQCLVGMPSRPSDHPPGDSSPSRETFCFLLSSHGRRPTVTSSGASRAGRLGHSRSSRWPWLTCSLCGFAGGTAGRQPRPCHLLVVGTSAITELCRASVSFSVSGNSNHIIVIKKTVKTKRVNTYL